MISYRQVPNDAFRLCSRFLAGVHFHFRESYDNFMTSYSGAGKYVINRIEAKAADYVLRLYRAPLAG